MISYAQNFEDVMLNRVFRGRSSGFYVDVGAMDPTDGSVTKEFYDRGWSGMNIEPDLRFHTKLISERVRDVNLSTAVGETDEVRPIYFFESQGISTFNTRFRDYFAERGFSWTEVDCEVTTLAEVCTKHVSGPIDFLKIDAEGWEGPIVRGGDWSRFRPTVLVIEATQPYSHTPAWHEWEPFITHECGYVFVYFDGLNRFFVRQEDRDLGSLFAYPPNVLDDFQSYATVRAEQRADAATTRLEQLKSVASAQSTTPANGRKNLEVLQGVLKRQGRQLRSLVEERRRMVSQIESLHVRIDELQQKLASLESELLEARLWVGRLSEKLASHGDHAR